jgi:hypothetical protein
MYSPSKIPHSTDVGTLNIPHLKRLWFSILEQRKGRVTLRENEHELDRLVLDVLGLGLGQTMNYLFNHAPSFEHFEAWIIRTAGKPDALVTDKLNAYFNRQSYNATITEQLAAIANMPPVFTQEELKVWEENGYIILKNAISQAACKQAEEAIWQWLEASPDHLASWYQHQEKHGIMVELIQHPALADNRKASRIHKAFSQLWENTDLRVTADRCGFHPPQTEAYPFPGPDLHWDINFNEPLTFGTQGILYLTDTPDKQGALTLVPGFHKKLGNWLNNLAEGVDPQQQDLHSLGAKAIGANAGDMVIWHQWLPHGSRPNLGDQPRIVQYINYLPFRVS